MTVTRMQILLTEEQAERLRDLSRARHMSISALVREMVDQTLREEQERLLTQQEEALAEIRAAQRALAQDETRPVSGEEIVEMIRQMREERTDEIVNNILGRD